MYEWLLILLVVMTSAFFSGSEIGFVSANRLKLEIKSRKNTLSGKYLAGFVRDPEMFLSTTLVGNNIVNVLYATLMSIFLLAPIMSFYEVAFDGGQPSEFAILVIQTIIASLVIMIFGEIIPKGIFRIHSDFLISLLAVPLQFCNWIFRPFIYISNASAQYLIRLIQPGAEPVEQVFRRQDIEMLLKEIGDDSDTDIDRDDSVILSNVLELSTKRVRETMIPRTEIISVEKNASLDEVLQTFVTSGYSKLPVYEDSIDNIIGVVFAYDLFKQPGKLSEIIREVKMVPVSQKSKKLLSDFQRNNISLAVVLDEYGGTAGLVTIEDLLEEVVGDIQDEYDTEESIMKKIAPYTYVLSGDVEIDELNQKYPEIQMPENNTDYETVAGFIINELGRIPTVNEEVLIENFKIIISKATQSRIETVKLIIME